MASYLPKPLTVSEINEKEPNAKGVIGAWAFSEGKSNTELLDSSDEKNNGSQLNSPTWVHSSYGVCIDFNGTNHSINLGTSPFYKKSATAVTVSFIAKISTTDFNGTVKAILDTCTGDPASGGMWIGTDDRGGGSPLNGLRWSFKAGGSSFTANTINNVFTTTPTLYQIVCTYKNGEGAHIYINGVEKTASSVGSGDYTPKNAELFFGSLNTNAYNFNNEAHGLIIWDKCLSSIEAKALYQDHFKIFRKKRKSFLYRVVSAITGNPYYYYLQQQLLAG